MILIDFYENDHLCFEAGVPFDLSSSHERSTQLVRAIRALQVLPVADQRSPTVGSQLWIWAVFLDLLGRIGEKK